MIIRIIALLVVLIVIIIFGITYTIKQAQKSPFNSPANFLGESEQDNDQKTVKRVRDHLNLSLKDAETILNGLSSCLEMPQLLVLSDQEEVRTGAIKRVNIVIEKRNEIDSSLEKKISD